MSHWKAGDLADPTLKVQVSSTITANTKTSKPENALLLANEFLSLGKPEAALMTLHEILIGARKGRDKVSSLTSSGAAVYEKIVLTYIDVCVNLRAHREVKDALHQYRNLMMATNTTTSASSSAAASATGSNRLEVIVEHLLKRCEEMLASEAAVEEKDDADAADDDDAMIDDELDETLGGTQNPPFHLLINAAARPPPMASSAAVEQTKKCTPTRFVWEMQRAILDLLRSSSNNSALYCKCASGASKSLTEAFRKTDFRRLCEIVRSHLTSLVRGTGGGGKALRGWDGFSSSTLQLHYRLRLDMLQCACTLKLGSEVLRLLEDLNVLKNVNAEFAASTSVQMEYYSTVYKMFNGSSQYPILAGSALKLAILSKEQGNQEELSKYADAALLNTLATTAVDPKSTKLLSLLHLPYNTKLSLVAGSTVLVKYCDASVQSLFSLLGGNKVQDPFEVVSVASALLNGKDDTGLKVAVACKFIELAKLSYAVLKYDLIMETMTKLLPKEEAELLLVKNSCVIDVRGNKLSFTKATTNSNELMTLSKSLSKIQIFVKPETDIDPLVAKASYFNDVRSNFESEHAEVLDRKNIIEKLKEDTERLAMEQAEKEKERKAEEEKERIAAEARRRKEEERKREREKLEKIKMEMELTEKKKYLEAMGKSADISEEKLQQMDTAELAKEHSKKLEKKKQATERKLREKFKKLDYITRAVRMEEIPFVEKQSEEKKVQAKKRYDEGVVSKLAKTKAAWEKDIERKSSLGKFGLFSFTGKFQKKIMDIREVDYSTICKSIEQDARKVALEKKNSRAEKRRQDAIDAKAEEERRQKEAEEKARREAELELRRKEEAEARAKEDERMRQEEEKKLAENREKATRYVPPSRRGGGGSGPPEPPRNSRWGNIDMDKDREPRRSMGGGDRDRSGNRFGGERGSARFGDRGEDRDRQGGSRFAERGDRADSGRDRYGGDRYNPGNSGRSDTGRWR